MQHSVILAAQPYGLGLNETLMPQYLKQLGYATHAVGKVRKVVRKFIIILLGHDMRSADKIVVKKVHLKYIAVKI